MNRFRSTVFVVESILSLMFPFRLEITIMKALRLQAESGGVKGTDWIPRIK